MNGIIKGILMMVAGALLVALSVWLLTLPFRIIEALANGWSSATFIG